MQFASSFKKSVSLLGAVCALSLSAHAFDNKDVTVVLVHGAFADGSAWSKVIPLLQSKGVKVIAVQNPLSSLADDVKAAQQVIDQQTGPVVLVGHSWGGSVITQAGTSDKVKALVYVAAFAPSIGQASGDDGKDLPPTPGLADAKPDANGNIYLTADSVAKNFAQDLSSDETKVMAATQGAVAAKCFGEPLTAAAWTNRPSFYIVSKKDRMIAPELEKRFAKKIKAKTTELDTSHVPMLSQPKQVAEVIMSAVDVAKK